MARLVRAGINPGHWLREGIPEGELQADALADLRTVGNRLSVFELREPLTAEGITAAVAAGREQPGNTGFVVFESDAVTALGIEIDDRSHGKTPDDEVNAKHRDLVILTDEKLLRLAREVIAPGEKSPLVVRRVEQLLLRGLDAGKLNRGRMSPKLLEKLEAARVSRTQK